MGAYQFDQYQAGADAAEAFRTACTQATWEHGHGGYSGSLAEKHSYVVIQQAPIPFRAAYEMANRLLDEGDPRIDDKWGPAGAIPITLPYRTVTLTGLAGERNQIRAVVEAALAGQLAPGERFHEANLTSSRYATPYRRYGHSYGATPGDARFTDGTAEVKIAKAPDAPATIDGWLFFGWASS